MAFTCPRRAENGMDDPNSPFRGAGRDLDDYAVGRGVIGQGRGCTYCGSMHPDDFMEAARGAGILEPTDKNYKVYVEGYKGNGPNGGKFYFQHLSPEQKRQFIDLLNERKVSVGYPGHFYVLPFFVERATNG